MRPTGEIARPRGRPRNVPTDEALDAAMRVFWAEGYDAASVDQLCRETGMPRASLYQDYGGKERLFLAAIDHYAKTRSGPVSKALGPAGSLEDDLSAFFGEVVALATRDKRTPGCLISCVLADAAGANETFRQELDSRFAAMENRILERLVCAIPNPDMEEVHAVAGMLAAVARGIVLRARSGAAPADLLKIANAAVRTVASTIA